jgi:dTDP-4-dehydrorhamnose reductase
MKRVLITGAEGALGQELSKAFWDGGWEVVGLDRKECDITDRDAVFETVRELFPDAVVNAAAYNAVDKAETDDAEFALAMAVNGRAPGYLAAAAREVGAAMVHFSTDYVFSGAKGADYVESDEPDPVNRYGVSKAAGEKAVAAAFAGAGPDDGRWYVCRTARLFGREGISPAAKPTFVSIMRKLGRERQELRITHEEPGMPSFTRDVAEAAFGLAQHGRPSGIYHLVNDGPAVTWFQFAEELFALEPTPAIRLPVTAAEQGARPAKRPAAARLVSTKLPMLRPRVQALADFLSQPEVSIVIVTYEAERLIAENLERLFALPCAVPFEVIVTDNGSSDRTPQVVRERFPQVKLVRNAYNSGFGHACNQGAALARGRVVIFFNPDMRMGEGVIERTYGTLMARPEIGVMGVKLVTDGGACVGSVRRDPSFPDQLAILLKVPHFFPGAIDRYLAKDYDLHRSGAVDSVRGSFFAMRRDVLNKVGTFDERNFFIWFEEVDLCKRVRAAGYVVWYEADVSCFDHVGASFGAQGGTRKQIWFSRSMTRYFYKWHPWWQYAVLMAVRPFSIAAAFAAEKLRYRPRKHLT